MKKTSVFSTLEIVLATVMIVISITVFILLQMGFLLKTDENAGFGEGIGLAFALVFYVIFSVGMLIACLYMIIEGTVLRSSVKNGKRHKALFILTGIAKILLCAPSVMMAAIVFSLGFIVGGIVASLFSLILLAMAVFGFICIKDGYLQTTAMIQ